MAKCALFVTVLILALTSVVSNGQQWTVTSPNLTSVLLGVSFNSTTFGYVSGNGILSTSNGAQRWNLNGPKTFEEAIYMDVETVVGTPFAFSTGLCLDRPIAVYSTDGKVWQNSTTKLLDGAFQDAQALSTQLLFVYGSFAVKGDEGNGYAVSTNGGASFTLIKWNSETQARYGSFVSQSTGWIAGGEWPSTADDVNPKNIHSMSRHLHIFKGTRKSAAHGHHQVYTARPTLAAPPPNDTFNGWRAVISRTTDGGQTWSTLFNFTSVDPNNGFYLNGIWFVNSTVGYVAGEGEVNGIAFAFVNKTINGGSTWTNVLNIPGGSILQVKFLNANYGYAVGGVGANIGATQQFWLTTNGGVSWTAQSVKYDYCSNIAIISTQLSFATLLTPFQTSSVATYN